MTSASRGVFPGRSLIAAVTCEGRVLGGVAIEYKSHTVAAPWSVRSLYMHTLFVIPEAQRRGLASKLIRVAEDVARARGLHAITLTVMRPASAIGRDDVRHRANEFLRSRHDRLVEYYAIRQGFARHHVTGDHTHMIKRL